MKYGYLLLLLGLSCSPEISKQPLDSSSNYTEIDNKCRVLNNMLFNSTSPHETYIYKSLVSGDKMYCSISVLSDDLEEKDIDLAIDVIRKLKFGQAGIDFIPCMDQAGDVIEARKECSRRYWQVFDETKDSVDVYVYRILKDTK